MRRRPHARSLLATLPLTLAGQASAQSQQSFEPFDSIEGTLSATVDYEQPPGSACDEQSTGWVEGVLEHTGSFGYETAGSVSGFSSEVCSIYFGEAWMSGTFFRDTVESLPQDPVTIGFEWRFEFHADSSFSGFSKATALVNFDLNRPCRVSFLSEHKGFFEATVGSIRNENYRPQSGETIDYYHFDSEVLGPGSHTLRATINPIVDRGFIGPSDATLWIRFDDAYCSPADLAEPFGMHDSSDIQAFIGLFLAQDLTADMNADGITDLADIERFVGHFLGGCVDPAGEP